MVLCFLSLGNLPAGLPNFSSRNSTYTNSRLDRPSVLREVHFPHRTPSKKHTYTLRSPEFSVPSPFLSPEALKGTGHEGRRNNGPPRNDAPLQSAFGQFPTHMAPTGRLSLSHYTRRVLCSLNTPTLWYRASKAASVPCFLEGILHLEGLSILPESNAIHNPLLFPLLGARREPGTRVGLERV